MFDCPNLAVPANIMQHVIHVESSQNPFAIGVVGGRLARQPVSLAEAVSTAKMLEQRGFNFSLGVAQVNRYNLSKYGLGSYQEAFTVCPNIQAGSQILRECYDRAQDWGKAFSCYYSGNFTTGFKHGYVQKIFASMRGAAQDSGPITLNARAAPKPVQTVRIASSQRARVVSYPAYTGQVVSKVARVALSSQDTAAARTANRVALNRDVAATNPALPEVQARYLQDPVPAGSVKAQRIDEDVPIQASNVAKPVREAPAVDPAFVY